ncbi:CCCH-type Zn-finger protein [Handroanthus impetiginosus]|uniref:CCCH-type Zn-finger protein n=1 Tax=Handroanthus impetiginosus TaxID=429701 RepID=A0A2G9I3H6_9LAMI|nr:CCCH-type Zn-finger protein [Handroanthus impetiginosus]
MSESRASSTSDKPPSEKLGLGSLVSVTAPFDPMTTDTAIQPSGLSQNTPDAGSDPMPDGAAEGVQKEVFPTYDEAEVANSIERELLQLSIVHAEIDAALERLEAEVEGKDVRTVKNENLDEEKNGKDGESAEEDNDGREEGNDIKMVRNDDHEDPVEEGNDYCDVQDDIEGQSGELVTNLGRHNHSHDRKRINYPMRPDAEDCAYYMKTGSCKFGLNCKFNHPPRRKSQSTKEKGKQREENSEKAGQTECKYYLTSGGCRYGKDCKYSHGLDKSSASHDLELNFLGLPIRPGEKECHYYMRNGSCKYGSNCRFHHPDPKTVMGGGSPSGYDNGGSLPSQLISSSSISSWSSPRAFTDTSPFVPVVFPPTQGAPTPSPEWNGYQAAAYPTSERSLPTPPAFAINNLPIETNFPVQHQRDMVLEEYPERPGEPECSFFLKTGDCKFKSNCKFHHPKNRNSKAKAKAFALNDKGLPLRPDEPICTHYHRFGICKYGPACKYDHPSKFAVSPPSFDEPPYSKIVGGAEQDR